MDRRKGSRVKLNRKSVDNVRLAIADGTAAIGKAIIEAADVPDAEPYGVGLVVEGGTITYVGGKKVGSWHQSGDEPRKPKALRVRGSDTIQTAAGWSFPAHLLEFGTVNMPAQPFATPARNAVEPRAAGLMKRAAAYRIARTLRS